MAIKLRIQATEEECDKTLEIFAKTPGFHVEGVPRFYPNTHEIGKVNPITGRMYIELRLVDQESGEIVG
jgi:hypothetical protein